MPPPLLDVEQLRVRFPAGPDQEPLTVVRDATFTVQPGEFAALVGESGCGKSITALSLTRLPPTDTALVEGRQRFEGRDLTALSARDLRLLRGRGIAYVFQDPASALNPVLRIGEQLREAFPRGSHRGARREAACEDLLRQVRLQEPRAILRAYPHELSGGMQQRALIAMAIAARPRLLVADEPTTALDVTTQRQVLDLLEELRTALGMAVLLITHNLGIVARFAERVHVMYAGETVESGETRALLTTPRHPYTTGLLAAVPRLDEPSIERLRGIPGRVPPPSEWGHGCVFAPRCRQALACCAVEPPPSVRLPDGRVVRCHLAAVQPGESP